MDLRERGPVRPPGFAAPAAPAVVIARINVHGSGCVCGEWKRPGTPVCWNCWRDLLPTMQYDIRDGVFGRAEEWLAGRRAERARGFWGGTVGRRNV